VSVQEYADLSNGYEFHICADISINALLLAQENLFKCNKKGIFICADITNIPLQDNICDTVISQHTLYHVPKNEQAKAVEELYRVARPGAKIVIVYSWFYRSVLMNICLLPVQLYRIARHLAGKIYVRLFKSKPRLYFYAHSYKWFKTKFSFSNQIEIYSWSSINKYFLNIYIHSKLGGKRLLKWIAKVEEKHSRLMGRIGEYPVIVITKK
jgi:ubiquinone/menaquinone biosynthesis C-methylase UbiE